MKKTCYEQGRSTPPARTTLTVKKYRRSLENRLMALCLILAAPLYGQDSHYWNLQYGTKATLLGGAVIGSVSDLSATYYNPGAISLFEDPKLIISTKVYEYERINAKNGAGLNKDLVTDKFSTAPNFFAFKIKLDSASKNKLAFSILTRQFLDFDLVTRGIVSSQDSLGRTTTTTGFFKGYQFLNELWGGLSYSHKINDQLGIGVTGFGVYRYQTLQRQCVVAELQPNQQISSYENFRAFNYTNYRALLKAGVAVKLLPFTLGLTVTSPSVNLLGSGSFNYSKVVIDPDSSSNNIYQTNFQDSLTSCYKSPLAVGIGAAYWQEKYNLHFSAEWYSAVNKYHPMDIRPFTAQGNGETVSNELDQKLRGVLNVGVGMAYKINNVTNVSAGITTDYSANDAGLKSNIALTNWNIYHFSAGSNFKIGKSEITLGLSYSIGQDMIEQQVDITDLNRKNNPVSPSVNTEFQRVKVLFGFIF